MSIACSSSSTSGDSSPGPAQCGAIEIIPPIIYVTDAVTGELLCDPIITIASDGGAPDASAPDAHADGSTDASAEGSTDASVVGGGQDAGHGIAFSCDTGDSTRYAGCPTSPPDGGSLACVFAVGGFSGTVSIEVSAPGHASAIVADVHSGTAGCVGTPSSASTVTVALQPL